MMVHSSSPEGGKSMVHGRKGIVLCHFHLPTAYPELPTFLKAGIRLKKQGIG